jgi:TP901 family phage tail tape measure protein
MAKKVALTLEVLSSGRTKQTINEVAELELNLAQVNKELREARKQGDTDTYKRLRQSSQALKDNIKILNKDLTNQRKEFEALRFVPGSYNAISAELGKLKREFKDLSEEARNGIAGQDLRRRINSLNNELKEIDASVGVFSRNVGNYASAFRGLGGILAAAGIGFGINEVVQAVGESVRVFRDYEQQNQTLAAISGATREELKLLTQQSRDLGEQTQFTAKQVSELQTNFARVGFTSQQILAATEATLNLSIATTEGIERTSEVIGAAINGFGLAADEADRVSDVLAAGFNSTALNLEKFAEAQKFVAATAQAANVDIETTTASLGALSNAGLEGSNSGTALRRVLSDLSNENSKLAKFVGFAVNNSKDYIKALDVLNERQVDNAKATELVGRVGANGLLILSNQANKVRELTTAYRDSNGEAARTAAIVGDTLAQDLLKAQSAIEGLRLNFVDLAGGALRGAVQGFTEFVGLVSDFIAIPVSDKLREEQSELNGLVTSLFNANISEGNRNRLIEEIQAKYPAFIENIDIESASTEGLQQQLAKVNNEYEARILLQVFSEEVTARQEELTKRLTKEFEAQLDVGSALSQINDELGTSYTDVQVALAALGEATVRERQLAARDGLVLSQRARLYEELSDAVSLNRQASIKAERAQRNLTDTQDEQQKQLEFLRQNSPELADALEAINSQTQQAGQAAGDAAENLEQAGEAAGNAGQAAGPAAGSIAALRKELGELNNQLEGAISNDQILQIGGRIGEIQEEINQKLRERNLLLNQGVGQTFDTEETDKAVSDLEKALGFFEEIDRLRSTPLPIDTDAAISASERIRDKRIADARESFLQGIITERELAFQTRIINLEAQQEITDARKAEFEVGSDEYLDLVAEEADLEFQIRKANIDREKEERGKANQEILNSAFNVASQVGGLITSIQERNLEERTNAQIQAVEQEYAARIEAAEGNTQRQEELQAQLDEEVAEIERQAAEKRREIARKEIIINGIVAAAKTVASIGLAPVQLPLLGLALAAQAAAVAAQLAALDSQQFALGGEIEGPSHSRGGVKKVVRSTGQRVELEGGEGVINKRSMSSSDVLSVKGTPAQIASAINSYRGYGIPFRKVKTPSFYQEGGVIPTSVQLVNPNQVPVTKTEIFFSEEQIDIIAREIANRTSEETGNAVRTALGDVARREERREFVKGKTGI